MNDSIVAAAIAEAEQTGQPVAELSLDRIAKRAGVSRSTMFRRIRSRQALEDAVRAAGVDPGNKQAVRERAVTVAAELIVDEGVGALTVEEVARRVECAVTSIHTQFSGRDGLLVAVFEQYAPLPTVAAQIADGDERFQRLESGVRAIYTAIFDAIATDGGVLEALVAEALAKPNGAVMRLVREHTVPRIVDSVGEWLRTQIANGSCRDLPLTELIPLLVAPLTVHLIVRQHGGDQTDPETAIDTYTTAFCRAVSP